MLRFQSTVFLIALILISLNSAIPATADAKTPGAKTSARASYQVKAGDSLFRIAEKTGVSVAELQRLNRLTSTALKPGQTLRLTAGDPKSVGDSAKGAPGAGRAQAADTAVHKVKKGDSLYLIARKHRLSVAQLQAWNGLSGTALKPGQTLRLAEPEPAPKPREVEATTAAPGLTGPTHTVAKGETLYRISRSSGVPVTELERLNGLKNSRIHPGQTLFLGQGADTASPVSEEMAVADDQRAPDAEPAAQAPPDPAVVEAGPPAQDSAVTPTENHPELERLARTISKLRELPYRFGGNGVNGIDCSGFVQRVFREFSVDLPRSAREQYRVGTAVERDLLQEGDLVFFRTYAKFPSHVGIYLGDNKMVHASTRSRRVVISDINQRYYKQRYIGAKRLSPPGWEGLNIRAVKGLLQEETEENDTSPGLTSRGTASGRTAG